MDIDVRQIDKFEGKLKRFKKSAIPLASRSAINSSAFRARKEAKKQIEKSFILRNKYTTGMSLRVIQTRSPRMRDQEAEIGSTASYMADQEFGGVQRGKGGAKAITTSEAAGQGDAKPRTKVATSRNSMRRLKLNRGHIKASSRAQRNMIAVRMAISSGKRVVYMDTGKVKGIFRVKRGTKKRPERAEVRMLYDMSRSTVPTPREPWLSPAIKITRRHMPKIYLDALRFRVRQAGLER